MKIINHDNFDRKGPGHDDKVVLENVPTQYAATIAKALNASFASDDGPDYFMAVPDDYKLQIFEP